MKLFCKALMRAALTLLMAATVTTSVMAQGLNGTGTRNDPFIIASARDWQTFADSVGNGYSYYGQYVRLTSDLSEITTMVGNDSCAFQGLFLGDGHTISLNLNGTEDYIAPFRYVRNAQIISLNTAGTINADTLMNAAGIIGYADSLLMVSCRSSVTIKGSREGEAFHAGLISESHHINKIYYCLFDGAIDAPDADYCAGFVADDYGRDIYLLDCLMSGTLICKTEHSGIFGNYYSHLNTYYCFYNTEFDGYKTGVQTDAQGPELMAELGFGWQIKDNEVVPITDVNDIRMSVFLYRRTLYNYAAHPIMSQETISHFYHGSIEKDKHYSVIICDSLGNTVSGMTDRGQYTITIAANEQEGMHGSISYRVYVFGLRTDSVGNYLIENSQDWDALAQAVNEFGFNYDFDIIKLTGDITVNSTVGTRKRPFSGTFDGCGHTIKLAIPDTVDVIAPFPFVESAVITRLNVTGTYNNPQAEAIAGFVNQANKDLILNSCRSSIVVTNTTTPGKKVIYSGLVSASRGTVKMNNCLFDGRLQAPYINAVNGFITVSLKNCLMNNCLMTGTLECDTLRSGVFFSTNKNNSMNLNNCYHNTDFSLEQGTHTSATGNELKSLLGDGWIVSNQGVVPNNDGYNIGTVIDIYDTGKYYHYTGLPADFSCIVVTGSFDIISTDSCFTRTITNSEGLIVDEAIEVGEYTATYTGKGQYSGSFTFSFRIMDYPEPLEVDDSFNEKEDGFYYVNLAKNDTLILNLSDDHIRQFKVYDSEGKDLDYLSNSRSRLEMHAPEGYIFKLTGTLITEEGEDEYDCYDYVNIFDGCTDSSPLLAGPIFSTNDSIPLNIEYIYSSGPDMTITFESDGSVTRSGLDFTVRLVKLSEISTQDIVIEDCPGGKIESDIKSAYYTAIISMTVKPDPGYRIDSLSVIDRNGNSIYVKGGTWYNNVATFMMPDTAVTVKAHFVPDDSIYYVKMPYKKNTAVSDTIRLTNDHILSFKVYDSEGKDSNYLNSTRSSLVMIAPQGYRFKLTGTLLTEECDDEEEDYYDFVNIYDGYTYESPMLAGPLYCYDEDIPVDLDTIYSSGSVMMIYFWSDRSYTNQGLDFTVTLVPADDNTPVNSPRAIADTPNWYLPDGRLFQGTPTPGTLYLQPGRKVIIIDN